MPQPSFNSLRAFLTLACVLLISHPGASAQEQDSSEAPAAWPMFRGAGAAGTYDGGPTATTWDIETGAGIEWSTEIPGLGHSSPVVWGDRIFFTTAISADDNSLLPGLYGDIAPVDDESIHEWRLYCLDRHTGQVLWQHSIVSRVPRTLRHTKSTHANPSVATDGETLVAMFGSEGLYAYDLDGNEQWQRDLGVLDQGFFAVPEAQWGYSSSPILFEDSVLGQMVIVQADIQDGSFLAAYSLADGEEVWKTNRADVPTFGTPAIYEGSNGPAIAVNGYRHMGGYDARTGAELWRMEGTGDIPTPTPIIANDLIYITNAHGGPAPVYAIRTSATGDLTEELANPGENIAWFSENDGAYMATPLVYDGLLYVVRHNSILVVFDAVTGERHYRERLGGGATTASPVAADVKLYIPTEDGEIFVVKTGREFELLATNSVAEPVFASPAIVEGKLVVRTSQRVLSIAEGKP
ncbi:MAG: PQQ-binding-like beta-propeller repeat protein [Acidobacteria bacterium]|nr:PQQ-binding-like beta-propeller repeat protein [Acidobacteriota bacterium]